MAFPKTVTVETSPNKTTLSFDVLGPSKVMIESQIDTDYSLAASVEVMKIATEPIEDATVPSLVDDATSSGIPSEDSHVIESDYLVTTSSKNSQSEGTGSNLSFAPVNDRGRAACRETGTYEHSLGRSIPTSSSGDSHEDVEDSTTSQSGPAVNRKPAFTKKKTRAKLSDRDHIIDEEGSPTADTEKSDSQYSNVRSRKVGRWTSSQDALLESMKEGGETWAAIATALGRGKKDVQQRYREVKTYRKEGIDEASSGHEKVVHAGGRSVPTKRAKANRKRSCAHRKSTPSLCRSSENECSSTTSPNPESADSEEEQQLYLHNQIREGLYPPYLSLEEDNHFTKRDCEILATVDSKMKRGRWLEMQANFFNATGQMIPISVFRDKCEAAEAIERARIRNAKIKSWKAGLDDSEQLDPNVHRQLHQHV